MIQNIFFSSYVIHQNEKRMRVWKHLLHCVVQWSIERSTSNGPKEPFWTLRRRRQSKAHLKSGVSSFSYRPVYCSNGCSKHYRDGFLPTSFPRLNPLCDWLVAISSSLIRWCLKAGIVKRHRREVSIVTRHHHHDKASSQGIIARHRRKASSKGIIARHRQKPSPKGIKKRHCKRQLILWKW